MHLLLVQHFHQTIHRSPWAENLPHCESAAFATQRSRVRIPSGPSRKHSSAGMSVRLTRERSWVRAPLLPLIKTLKTQALPGFQGFSFSVSVSESSISVLISAISEWKYSFRFLMIYEVNIPLDFRPSVPGRRGHSGLRC